MDWESVRGHFWLCSYFGFFLVVICSLSYQLCPNHGTGWNKMFGYGLNLDLIVSAREEAMITLRFPFFVV